jgi:nucleotide-binding universal stress UspA family protein
MFKKILTPIDGSEESRAIVRWAAGHARGRTTRKSLFWG